MSTFAHATCSLVLVAIGCGNDLPPPGSCAIPSAAGEPSVMAVPLVGHEAYFDDLHFAPALGKVLAAPEGVSQLYVVDPATLEVKTIATTGGTASADADAAFIYTVDRSNDRVSHSMLFSARALRASTSTATPTTCG